MRDETQILNNKTVLEIVRTSTAYAGLGIKKAIQQMG